MFALLLLLHVQKYFSSLLFALNSNDCIVVPLKKFRFSCLENDHEPIEVGANLSTEEYVYIFNFSVESEGLQNSVWFDFIVHSPDLKVSLNTESKEGSCLGEILDDLNSFSVDSEPAEHLIQVKDMQ